ncbi:hypothetical protein ACFOG5_19130 [Pedobacter fastidiosus]|uniref:hypothetical protein n=1 Tax=Pedobacter fastidiosus TaxID=2765361 RepID=UPI00164E2DFE|nr:hypothetical protein [Pedobacter fastidiosus]
MIIDLPRNANALAISEASANRLNGSCGINVCFCSSDLVRSEPGLIETACSRILRQNLQEADYKQITEGGNEIQRSITI